MEGQMEKQRDGWTNKAVYTTASVAYGWAGAVTEVKLPFGVFFHCMNDRRTNGPTERIISDRVT